MNSVVSRYAEALFLIAKEDNLIKEYQDEMNAWKDIFMENKEFLEVLSSAFLSKEERKEMLIKISKSTYPNILNFFLVVIDNNRIKNIIEIIDAFNSDCNEYFGVKEGLIYSIEPLSKEQLKQIQDKISKVEGMKVYLINKIDKSLIGGVRVMINDHVYDDSIKHHIEQLKQTLS